jgi:ArsR family transcriptional regulator
MPRLTNTLKALADPTRIRIVHLLRGREELCVCEITETLGLPQYTVSRHLGVLKAAGIVADWRQGKWMHYGLDPAMSGEDAAIVRAVCARAAREPQARQDARRLEQHLRPRANGEVVVCQL